MNLKKTSSAILFSTIKLVIYAVLIISVYLLMSKAFAYGEMVFSEEGMAQKGAGVEVQITIPKGASTKEIGDILVKNGLAENGRFFCRGQLFQPPQDHYYRQKGAQTLAQEGGPGHAGDTHF